MQETVIENKPSFWKKFEKLSIIIGLISAIAAIIGFYYQVQIKKNEIAFQLISKDYLTTNNNIVGLKSNYEYAGIPVKNLWLLKFRITNSGDITLFGKGANTSILDSGITFKFNKNIQILDKINPIQNNFPDHQLIRLDSNTIFLSFQQWRKNEFAVYSIYVKSNQNKVLLLPSAKRLIKDGDILINDLVNNQGGLKQPLLDTIIPQPWTLICRILGIILAIFAFIIISWGVVFIEYPKWYKFLKWKRKYYKKYRDLLNSKEFLLNESNFDIIFSKKDFIKDKEKYIKDPTEIYYSAKFWRNFDEQLPDVGAVKNWVTFYFFTLMFLFVYASSISIFLGLIIY